MPKEPQFTTVLTADIEATAAEMAALQLRVAQLEQTVALLNSMVLGGEAHSDTSRAMVRGALGRR